MLPLNNKFLRLCYFEEIGGTGRRNGRGATINAIPMEGCIINVVDVHSRLS